MAELSEINHGLNDIIISENIPVDGVVSTKLTWLGEQRVEASAQSGTYVTDFACNNQHAAINVLSLTGSGTVIFTGVSMSESSGLPVSGVTESFLVDATGRYQTSKKWLEITNIEIPVGITAISYDVGVLGYFDMQNSNFKVISLRVDMTSGGVNANLSLKLIKVQDDGNNKISLVTIEHIGVNGTTKSVVDEVRAGADDRSYTSSATLWVNGTNFCIKQSDYDEYFLNDENVMLAASKGEGFIVELEGTNGGNINNVVMLNLHLGLKLIG